MILCDNECDNYEVSLRIGNMCCNECSAIDCDDRCDRDWNECGQSEQSND